MRQLILAITALLLPAAANAGGPLGDSPPVTGQRTKVLTLGTFHLSEVKNFNADWLTPLLDKLAAYRPQIITIEAVAGEQCAMMKANPDVYSDAFETYCWDLADIEKVTGFSTAAANAEIRKTFDSWPAAPSATQRRRLAMLFLAAGDRPSAQVQWLRLPPSERHVGDGIDEKMLSILQRDNGKKNENYDVAAALAARLGLERVYLVDDHSSDAALAHEPEAFGKAQAARFEGFRETPLFQAYQRDIASMTDAKSTLAYYRKLNAAGAQEAQIRGDFGGALSAPDRELFGRHYVGWWEVRNLRMAANVRQSFVTQPGVRVLNIVGSSHKPWYDAFMGMMSDVEVIDAASALR